MAIDIHNKIRQRLKSEISNVKINRSSNIRFALAFPNVYSIGMASLGYQLVYEMINSHPNSSCERVFLPDADDIIEFKRRNIELFTYETFSTLANFDVIGFSVSFEMDYINILDILSLANIPVCSNDRDETKPLIIAGGPCCTFNPEPLADFIDLFVIGDAEEVLPEIIDYLNATPQKSRLDQLNELNNIKGVYVPSLYEPLYDVNNKLVGMNTSRKNKPQKAIASDLSKYPKVSCIKTDEAEFGKIDLVELTRGCGRRCRFCVASYINTPVRFRKNILSMISDGENKGKRYGLVGGAVFDHPESINLCESILDLGSKFTVSSVRLETVNDKTANLLAMAGQKTITIAPEAGSMRLRNVINKTSSNEDIFSAVEAAKNSGIKRLKLYFMVGLPTETDQDVEEIIILVNTLVKQYPSMSFRVSASCFVPKPFTPFQWHPMEQEKILKQRLQMLKRIKGVKISTESSRLSVIQAILARGGRGIGEYLRYVHNSDNNYFSALRKIDLDLDSIIHTQHEKEYYFPWSNIDMGISIEALWNEYKKAINL